MLTRKKVEGEIQYNDGEFAEIQTVGIEGIEKGLRLEIIQIHREDTEAPEAFERRFAAGMWLDILTITEISARPPESTVQNDEDGEEGNWQGSVQ
jgi:hypothetical protein